MTKSDQKKYILKNWSFSSGKRITEMLLRYFDLKELDKPDIVGEAKKIFNI